MEKIAHEKKKDNKKENHKSSLRRTFIFAVLYSVITVVILSGITIWGCLKCRKMLLPDSNEVSLKVTKTFDDGTKTQMSMVMGLGKEKEQETGSKEKEHVAEKKTEEKNEEQNEEKNMSETIAKVELVEDGSVYFILSSDSEEESKDNGIRKKESKEKEKEQQLKEKELEPKEKELEETEPNEKKVKYSIDKIENSYEALSPKRKIAYTAASVAMVGLPFIYSVAGILICGFWFYNKKLQKPIEVLADATENIAKQDLDFSIEYHSKDEMGMLCDSFEEMRQELYENSKMLWRMLEERKILQASVAHDLRNPIAIIEGYAEYLQLNIPEGRLEQQEILNIIDNLAESAKRLEYYTDSMRDISKLEELEPHFSDCNLQSVLREMSDDFTIMAENKHIDLQISNTVPEINGKMDAQILYRVLENIFSNSLRFAREKILIDFSLKEHLLTIKVWDDGVGFPEKILNSKNRYTPSMDQSGEHLGMGLVISNILCKKHGGELRIENGEQGGARVTIVVEVK
ncbi:MAG: HAMP domain-containing histidine kinase [Lachnospiraceae bacterium]|nr:HAMP domain-containing histidine kinase [Lachnospiraceae bacterium]